jgi:phenylacetyl-CoA:acceptor oxidoreductase
MEYKIPVYCNQCVCGPDLLKVVVKDGVAIRIEPNYDTKDIHPANGKICVKAYGLIHKLYNPYRIKAPMIRTNPNKGRDEDPGWKEISWDEAFRILSEKLVSIRERGFLDESGYPRLAVTLGSAGTAASYMGTFPAFLAAWGGPIDFSIGSGQGTKCYHTEHLVGELWHRAFLVVPDTPRTKYVLSLGHNTNASAGVTGVYRHAEARERGYKRVQVEPHLTVTGATSDEWIPIKPKTDAAFLYAILHVILHELNWKSVCDLDFLKNMTNSPYLVGPRGYFMRDKNTRKPLIWDKADNRPKVYDDLTLKDPALTGVFKVSGIEVGPDDETWEYDNVECKPSFQLLLEHMEKYTPEWASKICDVPAETIRRIAKELAENAMIGSTMEIDGENMPYRPIAIILGKTVNNGWGSYQVCWARTVIQILFGALEVPGSIIGTCVRINRPYYDRWSSVYPGEDGFMHQFLNPTSKEEWPSPPKMRGPYTELVPLAGNTGWSPFLGPTPLSWLFMGQSPKNWNRTTIPEVWMIYRANPVMSMWNTKYIENMVSKFPFIAAFAYELNETCWYADLLLPDSTDLESLQLIRIGSQSYVENFWDYYGFAIRQPVVEPIYNTMDMTDVATELSYRVGILADYNNSINNGVILGVKLKGKDYDYTLDLDKKYPCEEIWDRICRAATRRLTNGREEYGLEWFKKNGFFVVKYPRIRHYLYPIIRRWGLRFELPYQERLKRIGEELKRRLHERGIDWWDKQLEEYEALPECWDFTELWNEVYNKDDKDEYDLWLLTTRSFQYSWTSNISNPLMADVAVNVLGFKGVSINTETARRKGIKDGDWVVIESPYGKVRCRAIVREGVRPDTAVVMGQFGQWLTPVAKDLQIPSINLVAGLDIGLIDAIGSGADIVKVKIYKAD